MRKIVLATRGSKLALAQAEQVKALIEAKGFECELLIIKTKGDKDQNRPIHESAEMVFLCVKSKRPYLIRALTLQFTQQGSSL